MPVTSTADTDYKVAMFGNLTALTGDTMTYNCFQNRLTVDNLQVTGGLQITPATSTADTEYKVALFGNLNTLTGDTVTYNCFQNMLTVDNLQVTGGLQITPATSTADIEYEVSFFGLNDALTGDATMTFNPLDNRLTVTDLQVTDDVTIGDDLTVTGSTALGFGLKIDTLNSIISQTCRLLCWDNTASTGSRLIRTKNTLYYVGSTDTLHAPNVTATGDMDISGNITTSTFNSTTAVISSTLNSQVVISPTITSSVMINANNITAVGDLIVNAPVTTETENNRVAFVEAKAVGGVIDYGKGVLSRGNLFYNNDNETLFCKNLLGQELVYSPKLRITAATGSGFPPGEFTIDSTNGLTANHATSFSVRVNNTKQFQIETTQTTVVNDLQCNSDLYVKDLIINGVLPINYTQSYSGGLGSFTLTSNMWGQSKMILFSNNGSLYNMQTYGLDVKAWQKSTGTTGDFSLVNNTFNGLWRWEIVVDVQYNTTNSNARLNPKIYVERTRGGTATKCFGSLGDGQGAYFRGSNRARQISVVGSGVVDCQSGDDFTIKTLANLGQNTNFSNQTILFDEKTFSI
jgi:hypothetical protein